MNLFERRVAYYSAIACVFFRASSDNDPPKNYNTHYFECDIHVNVTLFNVTDMEITVKKILLLLLQPRMYITVLQYS